MRVRLCLLVFLSVGLVAAGCKEEGTIEVHSLTIKGVHAVSASQLKNALATRVSSKLPWGKDYDFDRSRFDEDLKRIAAFYADRGYPDARVTDFTVNLNKRQDAVDLTITVSEGEPIRVASVDLEGFDVLPAGERRRLESQVPLEVGRPRDRRLVVQTHELAVNALQEHGYPYAKVATQESDEGPAGKEARLTFTADPGALAHFGPITISGNESVGEGVIRRELTYHPGDLYRRSLLQDSQRRLYGMELFQFVTIEPQKTDEQLPVMPTHVVVAEGKHQRVNFGVGYGTEEKARADAEYHHVNFLGGGRSAGAHVRWSSLDRGVRLDFNQPYFFAPHFSAGGEGQQWYTYTPAYRSVISAVKATLTHRSGPQMSWAVSLSSEHLSSAISNDALSDLTLRNDLIALGLDPTTGEQNGVTNAAGFDFQRSTADSLLDAHRGYQIAVHAEDAGRAGGTFAYDALLVDGRHYLPLGASLVLATRLQVGDIRPAHGLPENVPFSKKYFLGGATSIRGWGRYEVSPLSGSGLPLGGNSLLALSAELRAQLRGKLGGVLFLDGGNVWRDSGGYRLGDLRYAIGPGLRYQTPIGPVRFDVGYQLNPIPDLLVNGEPQTRRWRMHFSIGQAF